MVSDLERMGRASEIESLIKPHQYTENKVFLGIGTGRNRYNDHRQPNGYAGLFEIMH